jgi:hypothetical protein
MFTLAGSLACVPMAGTRADCDDPNSYPAIADASCAAVSSTTPYPAAACLTYHHIPQCLPLLCWAAAGQVAMNSFITNPAKTVWQWQMVQTSRAGGIDPNKACYQQLPEKPCDSTGDPDSSLDYYNFVPQKRNFHANPNDPGLPSDQKHLVWGEIQTEIAGGGHPFVFEWIYADGAKHYLVVAGYYTTPTGKKRLRVWDPLPVANFDPAHPRNIADLPVAGGSARAIYFDTYAAENGNSDMGRDVVHYGDYYQFVQRTLPQPPTDLRVGTLRKVTALSKPLRNAVATPPSPFDVSFEQARLDSLLAARNYLSELRIEIGAGGSALQLGTPFPIVALGLNDLQAHDGHPPAALLGATTHVVLYPVTSRGAVVDSFLTIRGPAGWAEGGYSNTTVTQLVNAYRNDYAAKHHLPVASFYLLSVPALSAFFAVAGSGPGAVLIPASDDESIHATAGIAQPAHQLLPALIDSAKHYFNNGVRPVMLGTGDHAVALTGR